MDVIKQDKTKARAYGVCLTLSSLRVTFAVSLYHTEEITNIQPEKYSNL